MNPETKIKAEIQKKLGARRDVVIWNNPVGVAVHTNDQGQTRRVKYGTGGEGAPDLFCEVLVAGGPGTGRPAVFAAVWLEVKTPTGRLRPEQVQWHEAARSRGRHAYVVRSVEDALRAVAEVQALGAAT